MIENLYTIGLEAEFMFYKRRNDYIFIRTLSVSVIEIR